MTFLLDHPIILSLVLFPAFWLSARAGLWLRQRRNGREDESAEDLSLLLGATLTLLGLIIGFTFSMAVGRYDQRKNLEEAEANAIGTEFVRADLLPPADAAKVRQLLRSYLDQRTWFYTADEGPPLRQIELQTARLQGELWSAVTAPAAAQPNNIMALVVAGMNDVLNSQGYTQAAWWNRIPLGAWVLVIAIAVFSNFLVGYGARKVSVLSFLILPIALSITLLLIADIDSPRHGVIKVRPRNLEATAESLLPAGGAPAPGAPHP